MLDEVYLAVGDRGDDGKVGLFHDAVAAGAAVGPDDRVLAQGHPAVLVKHILVDFLIKRLPEIEVTRKGLILDKQPPLVKDGCAGGLRCVRRPAGLQRRAVGARAGRG